MTRIILIYFISKLVLLTTLTNILWTQIYLLFLFNACHTLLFYKILNRNYKKTKRSLLISILTIDSFIPFLGFIFLAIFYVLYKIELKHFRKDKSNLETNSQEQLSNLQFRRVEIYNQEPYSYVIKFGTNKAKRNAIDKLVKIRNKEAVNIIKLALQDEIDEVKVYATNAISKIESSYQKKIKELTSKIKLGDSSYLTNIQLADNYYHLYLLNLYDDNSQNDLQEKAFHGYISTHQLYPDKIYPLHQLTKLYKVTKNYTEIVSINKEILTRSIATIDKVYFELADAYYHLKDFKNTKDVIEKINISKLDYDDVKVVNFWRETT